jgi:hypothetical protein
MTYTLIWRIVRSGAGLMLPVAVAVAVAGEDPDPMTKLAVLATEPAASVACNE